VGENRPGPGGTLAPEQMAATAKPDGYTISQLGPLIFRAPFIRKTTYDPTTDYEPVVWGRKLAFNLTVSNVLLVIVPGGGATGMLLGTPRLFAFSGKVPLG
jgi:tripartite-type tricarboxylate transporter receptor subunit TctC